MKEIKAEGWRSHQALEVVSALKEQGYVMGVDFDWEYHKPKRDDTTYQLVYNRHTVFRFYKDELATWFSLRYL